MNLIWLNKDIWECDWIKELLSNIEYNEIFDYENKIFLPNSIIICSGDPNLYLKYFLIYEKLKYNFVLVHLSNQYYLHNTKLYNLNHCKLIIRTQYTPDFENNDNIIFIPLGYKKNFWNNYNNNFISINERKYTFSFLGQIKHQIPNIKFFDYLPENINKFQNNQQRLIMYENLKKINTNYFFHITDDFDSKDSIDINKYRDIFLNTKFIPCPMGNYNIDSFRLYEALECGCIPIIPSKTICQNYDYYNMLFNTNVPFIKINNWENFENIINNLLNNEIELEKLQLKIINWWHNYKLSLKITISNKIMKFLN